MRGTNKPTGDARIDALRQRITVLEARVKVVEGENHDLRTANQSLFSDAGTVKKRLEEMGGNYAALVTLIMLAGNALENVRRRG